MDRKVTLSFDEQVIQRAKAYAAENNISLSRLIEFLLNKAVSPQYKSFEDLPISDWVSEVSEGKVEYKSRRSRKNTKADFYRSRK